MAQINQIDIPQKLLAHPGQLDEEETGELNTYLTAATSHSTNVNDMAAYTENAMHLFFEQRRRTRMWVIGCSVAAAGFGFFMGFFAGKKPSKGG
jgi:hypothetical protein